MAVSRTSSPADNSQQPATKRGRSASNPIQMTRRGWLDVLWRVKNSIEEDKLPMVAGGMVFFGMLAIFPALIATVSIYGMVASPEGIQQQINALSAVLPSQARDVLSKWLQSLVAQSDGALGWGAALGILGALWSASTGTDNLMKAINIAYDEDDQRGFVHRRGIALSLTVGLIVGVVLLFALVAVMPAVLGWVGLGETALVALDLGRWPVVAVLVVLGLSVLYRVAPYRKSARMKWITPGSLVAAVIWIAASLAFSTFVSSFSSYDETYGSLGGVIVLMLWLYISAFVVLLGAELNAELEAQTKVDSTIGPDRPMGERGAVKADVLGETRHSA